MTGRTHLAVGAAAAMLAAGPAAGLTGLAVAAAGGAVGATLPDLDVRDTAHPWRERLTRAGAAALLVGALVFDAASGASVTREAMARGLTPAPARDGRARRPRVRGAALGAPVLLALAPGASRLHHRDVPGLPAACALYGRSGLPRTSCSTRSPTAACGSSGRSPAASAPASARRAASRTRAASSRRCWQLPSQSGERFPCPSPPRGRRARGRESARRRRRRARSGPGTGRRAPRPTSPSRA